MAREPEIPYGQLGDRQVELWTQLASNAVALAAASAAASERARLLLDRATLWDQLAAVSTPACGQVYRDAATQCRSEVLEGRPGVDVESAG
ncbi:hypothetical protein ACTXG6_15720 [Pseudonocardia sp. Cha107L01]|uniref:hypothetical protein n=1 Tax=Pseudonocardia sp. Cha107L01 TaxID=3457576 RepID=UPI00403E9D2D